jgi:hypothetical protein
MAVSGYAFGQTAEEMRSDVSAVKKVVMAEADARDDFDAWIACYADSPQTSYVNTGSPGTAVYRKNLEEVKAAKKKSLAASPKSGFTLDSQDDWVIRVVGNMAWVRHQQHFTMLATNQKLTAFSRTGGPAESIGKVRRTMENLDGCLDWRFQKCDSANEVHILIGNRKM